MMTRRLLLFALFASATCLAQPGEMKILTNHLGYETHGPKHAVILGSATDKVTGCDVEEYPNGRQILSMTPQAAGPVLKWHDWYFWTIDFDGLVYEGQFYIACKTSLGDIQSFPFTVQNDLLVRNTMSDVLYWFKDERSSGPMDQADHHLPFEGSKKGTIDAHGGWWDATGDYGKHLSHLSFSTYFNPQQIPLVVYSLLKSEQELKRTGSPQVKRYRDRILDEAMFGADYLVRLKDPAGSFYRSITGGGEAKAPQDRKVAGEMKRFGIAESKGSGPSGMIEHANKDTEYEVSYRSGGGVAIAALALASTYPVSGEFKNADYLKAAEDAFDYLEKNNNIMTNDGHDNIVDDYCALTAATELYKATHKEKYKAAADHRAQSLMSRLISTKDHENYWRADDGDRPFFHASDAGFPVVSLLYYSDIADATTRAALLDVVKKSLTGELATTAEVTNPFGYAREYVQDKSGARRTSFFYPHNADTAPWWQGENARLASLATAANLAARYLGDADFAGKLHAYSLSQINWILGLNPFDSSMLNGIGRNNPAYMYFDSWEFTNAPGGISNGITSGFKDEDDIDYNLSYQQTDGADNTWRWQEQWLPHDSWYLLAIASGMDK